MQSAEPIFGTIDGEVGAFAQGGSHIFCQPHLVLHHQYPHNCSIAQPRLSQAEVRAKGQISPLRYAGFPLELGCFGRKTFPRKVRRTADPSASPDFLLRVAASVNGMWFSLGRTTYV